MKQSQSLAVAVALVALLGVTSSASAAVQAYVITGTWDSTGIPIGAAKGNVFEAVWLYDPTPYDETTNPTGALDYTAIADGEGALNWPGYQSYYRIPSPTVGLPELIPNTGPGGINYLDVNLADPNNPDFPRSKMNPAMEPTDQALIKVANDVPDFGGADIVELIDHIDMTSIGLSPVNRWNIFFANFNVLSNQDLPADLDGDVFSTGGAAWGGGVNSNFAYTNPGMSFEQIPMGDASRDGTVDGGDYTLWADNFLSTGALWKHGDFNIDGVVDGGDYTIWADHFMQTIPFNSSALATAVPEPSSLVLAVLAGAVLLAGRKARRRR